ncbi:MAG TPA: response regulator transcription factor [Gemmatimonadaceae bacterium]|jgi:DNA-binding response OmpR family regulator
MVARILVVEDNPDLAYGLRNNLEIEGYEVDVAADGPSGIARTRSWKPDLMILDLMLPGLDGYRVLRTIRAEGFDHPTLILTARGEESDKVMGFRHGADDYVTKPFGVLELMARVEALLRRATKQATRSQDGFVRFGEIEVERGSRTVRRRGTSVYLAPLEYELLLALYERNGDVASRHELMRQVWGHQADVVSRTVDTHILELRKKLEDDPARPNHILTVRKAGYRLAR